MDRTQPRRGTGTGILPVWPPPASSAPTDAIRPDEPRLAEPNPDKPHLREPRPNHPRPQEPGPDPFIQPAATSSPEEIAAHLRMFTFN